MSGLRIGIYLLREWHPLLGLSTSDKRDLGRGVVKEKEFTFIQSEEEGNAFLVV